MLKEAVQKGAFVKHCPCSPGAVPCGYFNLNLQSGCPFDCSYCILQAYLDDKDQGVFYTNWADMEAELRNFLAANRDGAHRHGELSDSLAFENVRPQRPPPRGAFPGFPGARSLSSRPRPSPSAPCWTSRTRRPISWSPGR